jgi:hypothetical protein
MLGFYFLFARFCFGWFRFLQSGYLLTRCLRAVLRDWVLTTDHMVLLENGDSGCNIACPMYKLWVAVAVAMAWDVGYGVTR